MKMVKIFIIDILVLFLLFEVIEIKTAENRTKFYKNTRKQLKLTSQSSTNTLL